MWLWACIYVPQLPLLVAEQGQIQAAPLLIETTQRQRRLVAFANKEAQAAGIQVGMTIATALSLVETVTVQTADRDQQARALQRLAVALYQFSPHIHVQRADCLMIELSGSLRLFKGAESLAGQLQHCVSDHFRQFKLALCSNPFAALLLARSAFTPANSATFHDLVQIESCSVIDLELTPAQQERLLSMGINRVGELLALPGAALRRRFGREVLVYLNQLQGLEASPRQSFHVPDTFTQSIEFVQEVERSGQLVFPLQRLISYLEQFLRVRQQAVAALSVRLRLRQQPSQPAPEILRLPLQLASADYRASHIMPLLQLQLERLQLTAPVLAMAVSAKCFVDISVQQQDLLCADRVDDEDRFHLLDRLKARLGEKRVIGLTVVEDHRPECSWQATQPGTQTSPGTAVLSSTIVPGCVAEDAPLYATAQRPCWLLPKPLGLGDDSKVPVHGTPLQLLCGPERIDTGWWDNHSVNRDYYIARHDSGQRYWVFYERQQQRWFLHGVFG